MTTKINWGLLQFSSNVRASLHHQIAERIGSSIASGSIAPGSVLPNESLLGAEFGVSRTALREAIKVLAAKGLVEVRRKTGTRVRPHAEWNMLDPEVLSWLFSGTGLPATLTDLLEVRKIIEPAGARMAAERATAQNLSSIERAYLAMEAALADPLFSIEPDLSFHLAVLDASHNAFMRSFGALIQTVLKASFRLTSSNRILYRKTVPLHRVVLEAIQARRGDQAEAAMLAVLTQTSRDIATQIKTVRLPGPSPKLHKRSRRLKV